MSHYASLGLESDATLPQIRKAYFSLARLHHPDKNGGKPSDLFDKVSTAYQVLSVPEARQEYDTSLTSRVTTPSQAAAESSFAEAQRRSFEEEFAKHRQDVEADMKQAQEDFDRKIAQMKQNTSDLLEEKGKSHNDQMRQMREEQERKSQQREREMAEARATAERELQAAQEKVRVVASSHAQPVPPQFSEARPTGRPTQNMSSTRPPTNTQPPKQSSSGCGLM